MTPFSCTTSSTASNANNLSIANKTMSLQLLLPAAPPNSPRNGLHHSDQEHYPPILTGLFAEMLQRKLQLSLVHSLLHVPYG
jgi:hypothetical protein